MIQVTRDIAIGEDEIHLEFLRSSGPGGQNVNKVATAVQLRFDVSGSPSLPEDVRERLTSLAGNQITDDGILIVKSARFRTQWRNRQDGIDRLVELIRSASQRPKVRRRKKVSLTSKLRRLESKRYRSKTKRLRRPVRSIDE